MTVGQPKGKSIMKNIKYSSLIFSLGAGIVLISSAGCETEKHGTDGRSEGRALDDKHITGDVKEALKNEPVYKFEGVDVQTFGGVVQLSGFVNTSGQKQRAGEVVQRVWGVREVINGLSLKPAPPTPTGRTTDTLPRIYSEQPTQGTVPAQPAQPNPTTEPK
jgi:hypothetical protein